MAPDDVLNRNALRLYADWAVARIVKDEDPREGPAFVKHLRAIGANWTTPREYGWPGSPIVEIPDVLVYDLSESLLLPRSGDYPPREEKIDSVVIHNTGGDESLERDNGYHRFEAIWDVNDRTIKAPHVAYSFWTPADPAAWLASHPTFKPPFIPAGIVVKCNRIGERSWHAGGANDRAVGVAFQGNGEIRPPTEAQKTSIRHLIGVYLPRFEAMTVVNVWGHGELSKVYGGGPDYGNVTICPGKYGLAFVKELRGE